MKDSFQSEISKFKLPSQCKNLYVPEEEEALQMKMKTDGSHMVGLECGNIIEHSSNICKVIIKMRLMASRYSIKIIIIIILVGYKSHTMLQYIYTSFLFVMYLFLFKSTLKRIKRIKILKYFVVGVYGFTPSLSMIISKFIPQTRRGENLFFRKWFA